VVVVVVVVVVEERWKELCAAKGKWKDFGVGGMDERG